MARLSSLKQLFKKPMDQDLHLNLDQPEAPVQEVEAPVEPIAEVVNEAPVEDRSAFNCEPCGGEGLKDQATICPNCQGTGKVG